jgi:FKBP-type peptidyl-prolyl cis-trans isomerase FkpA
MNRLASELEAASLAALALALVVAAAPARAEKAPTTDDEKTIYALGVSVARNLQPFGLSEDDLQFLFAGIRDGALHKEPQVSLDEYGPRIRTLAQTRAAEVAKAERAASEPFLAKEAAADGAQKLDSGLIKRVIKPGTGPMPTADDTVKVDYHGTLRDGTVFDSSVERGEPATFPLSRVIPCWTQALQTMKVGEKDHITCPPDLAYGDAGAPPRIPPGAALAFDVELLEIVKPAASSSTP